eukprot:scaffold51605_cov64-Phaeocystis_antarctica.AAC.5
MAEALKAQGNASFKEGRYDHAVGYFTSAIDLDGTRGVLHRGLEARRVRCIASYALYSKMG